MHVAGGEAADHGPRCAVDADLVADVDPLHPLRQSFPDDHFPLASHECAAVDD